MPLFARLSDVFGRKPVLLAANTTFFIGSVIGGAAKGLGTLLAGRVIQGIGAGGLLVLPNVVISDLFSQRERGFYLSVIGMTWAVASALGAVVGGFFAEKVSWRWCFFVNLPFEAVSIALVLAYLDVHRPSTRWVQGVKAIDWLGAAVLAGATVMLLLGLEFGGVTYPWTSGVVIGLIVGGTLGFAAFVGVEVKVANRPLLPVRVFAHRSPAAILGVVFTHGTCYIAAAYFLPLYFQLVLGASPLLAGAWFLVTAATLAITTIVSGKYMQRTGRYLEVVYFGTMMMALGFTLLTNFPPNRSWLRIVMYQIVVALGIGPLFQSPLIALQTNLAPADIAAGSAAYSSIRQLACGISVVVGQVLFQAKMKDHLENLAKAGISGDLARSLANGDLISTAFSRDVVRAATSDSLARMWIFYAVVGLLGLVFSFGIKKKMLMRDHVEHMTGLDELSGNEDDVSAVVVKGEGKGGIV
ncbi:uncharacterized protein KY384_001749 [Bacidia gigantensis]|uniref:uncharacterized protein n=1 Tax=Bacidia gigantensis TaxID=2732470 RepID=UPI001D057DF3|nr:uncharacterized protein KY384_001749 [Bacidia gigantensis]KAG8532967.1 hypothetical protein KY384_001749 [Bacidia gigantensis]